MTLGINTSPLAGIEGDKVTPASALIDRLERELVGNVSARAADDEPRCLGGAGGAESSSSRSSSRSCGARIRAHRGEA